MHTLAFLHRALAMVRRPLTRRAAPLALLDLASADERGARHANPWNRAAQQPFGLLVTGSIAQR